MAIENKVCLLIKCQSGDGKGRLSELSGGEILDSGTGFFLKDNAILTAQHVVKEKGDEQTYVVLDDKLIPISISEQLSGFNEDTYFDYALCKSEAILGDHFDVSFSEPRNNEKLLSLGFSRQLKAKSSTAYPFNDGAFYLNKIPGFCFQNPALMTHHGNHFNNGFIMMYEESLAAFPHGMSGGPIVSEGLQLRGLLSLGYGSEKKILGCQGLHLYRPLLWINK